MGEPTWGAGRGGKGAEPACSPTWVGPSVSGRANGSRWAAIRIAGPATSRIAGHHRHVHAEATWIGYRNRCACIGSRPAGETVRLLGMGPDTERTTGERLSPKD